MVETSPNSSQSKMMSGLVRVTRILCLAGIVILVVYKIIPYWGHVQERQRIYERAQERIIAAGGWQAIETNSLSFAAKIGTVQPFSGSYYWRNKRLTTNALPPELEMLQPRSIEIKLNTNGIAIMHIKLSGIHRTGTRDESYYGIWLICSKTAPDYTPQIEWRDHGMRGLIERKGDSIFEVR